MKKIATLERFLEKHNGNLNCSQFTIDYIEELLDKVEDYRTRQPLPEADFLHAMSYRVDNIVVIMRPELVDLVLFKQLAALLERLAKAGDSATRRKRMAEGANLN